MDTLFIFTNFKGLPFISGKTFRICTTSEELESVLYDMDVALARGAFKDSIPTARLVERFERRADLTGPGDNGNDYVFINAWGASCTREQALQRLHTQFRVSP
jgi:hypothetical protein